jgi:hypothetical protein
MDKDYLLLKRATLSRPSGQWSDDDFDVLANGEVVGRIYKGQELAARIKMKNPACAAMTREAEEDWAR